MLGASSVVGGRGYWNGIDEYAAGRTGLEALQPRGMLAPWEMSLARYTLQAKPIALYARFRSRLHIHPQSMLLSNAVSRWF